MLVHPLFKTLATRPELLAEHAGAYLALASAEAAVAAQNAREVALFCTAAAVCAAFGVGFGGIALLFVAALPLDAMPAPWLLVVVPGVPLAAAAALWWAQRQRAVDFSFPLLREQFSLDHDLFKRAAGH